MLAEGPKNEKLPRGLDAMWDRGTGLVQRIVPRQGPLLSRARRICEMEGDFSDQSDSRLRDRASELRAVFRCGRETADDVDRAFAILREIARRQVGLFPFPEQIAAALAMDAGCVVELATGEGKTLSATMPATLAGWRGRGCHIITTNDYLAQRDAQWMDAVYHACGLRVGHVTQQMDPDARRRNYAADITYTTNKEVTADFLRDKLIMGRLSNLTSLLTDRMAGRAGRGPERLVMRGLACAIVDEADSILIDEAVTPLIISGDAKNPQEAATFQQAADLAGQLAPDRDYRVNHRYREIELTAGGKQRLVELTAELPGIWRGARRREELITQALTARELFGKGDKYVIDEGKIVIVDDFTGRIMPDRTWRDGLHQAIEAKEQLQVNPAKETLARISFQRFFRMYDKLAGMTGTAWEARGELWQIYHLPVVRIPTHKPCIRTHEPTRIFATADEKWDAVVEAINREHQTGRPILVGTRSVADSEQLSQRLEALGLAHQVLNAVKHAEEASIVAEAGQPGRITVATNMAGRGTDIKLGRGVAELGGLCIIATERHESGRIDRQLYGRAGRQGDPGSAAAYASMEEELIRRYTRPGLRRMIGMRPRLFDLAQKNAQALALRQRKAVLKADDWLEENLGFAGREV